jgi:hypothetical protein
LKNLEDHCFRANKIDIEENEWSEATRAQLIGAIEYYMEKLKLSHNVRNLH